MTTSTDITPISRRGVPLWAQIVVWAFLAGLLVPIGMGLSWLRRELYGPETKS